MSNEPVIKSDSEALVLEGDEMRLLEAVNETADGGSAIQEEIINTYEPRLKARKRDFINDALKAELGVEDLRKVDKKTLAAEKRRLSYEYGKVRDFVLFKGGYPQDSSKAKLDAAIHAVATAVKWLPLLGEGALLREWLSEYGLKVEVTAPNAHNTLIAPDLTDGERETLCETLAGSIEGMKDTQRKIDDEEQRLCDEYYDSLPDEVKYSKENKKGLKPRQFRELVVLKALRNIEEEEAQKKAQKATDNAMDSIGNNRLLFNLFEPESARR